MNKDSVKKVTIKDNIKNIYSGIKESFSSKDKNIIIKSVGSIAYTLIFAIIIKIPFLFVKTILLDFLNTSNISYDVQNIIAISFETIYILVAFVIIYKNLKKYFIKK